MGLGPTDVAVGLGAVWVTNHGDGTISKIDPVTGNVETFEIGAPVAAIAVDEGSDTVWVAVSLCVDLRKAWLGAIVRQRRRLVSRANPRSAGGRARETPPRSRLAVSQGLASGTGLPVPASNDTRETRNEAMRSRMEHIPGSTHPINEEPARADDLFTTETTGLPEATRPQLIRLTDGDRFALGIQPVRKRLEGSELRMLGYNGSIPGPTLHVDQGSEIAVEVTNDGDVEATVHWHGLRLENRYDGVPHETQSPIPIGGTFTYKVQFPDAGFYWYHPHIREDFGLEMGLYGTIIVEPADPTYWPPVDRQLSITLDDLLVEDGHVAPFNRAGPNYTAMGRFGNVMLINGEAQFSGEAAVGEVVRLYLVNTANTRIFNFALPGSRMKLVGGTAVATSARRSSTR